MAMMTARGLGQLLLVLIVAIAPTARGQPDADGFEHTLLIHHPDIDVFLLARQYATPADEHVLGFLIENKTGHPLQLPDTDDYRIEASGRIELFHRQGYGYRQLLPAGETRWMDFGGELVSSFGIPPRDSGGFPISATAQVRIQHAGGELATPPDGVTVVVEWIPPDDLDIAKMKRRLRDGLVDPSKSMAGMSVLLDDPRVGSAIKVDDLITGLRARAKSQVGSEEILRYIDEHWKHEERLVRYALDVIARRDYLAVSVLARSTSLHDVRLIEPLRSWATGNNDFHGAEFALELLSKQLDLAPNRAALTAELGRVWYERSPVTQSGNLRPRDSGVWWAEEMGMLALTRDRTLIPKISPYLDRQDVVDDAAKWQVANSGISTRACDVAYNVILDLLGRDGERFRLETGRRATEARKDPQVEYARRDQLIAKLKAELPAR
jgi:hypothetical protein